MYQNYTIDKSEYVVQPKCHRIYYKIDGEDKMSEMEVVIEDSEFKINQKSSLTVENKKTFELEIKEEREICIKDDNIKLFRVNSITKEMDVNVSYPENLLVTFFNVGVVKRFQPKHIDSKNSISRIHKSGLILPHQGFGLSFVKK